MFLKQECVISDHHVENYPHKNKGGGVRVSATYFYPLFTTNLEKNY